MNSLKIILLVDDDPRDSFLVREVLTESNLANQIVSVNDGVEAMEYLRCEGKFKMRKSGNPAVILLDIKMPRMNGIEVLKEIRNDKKLKLIPVVMLTSSRQEPDLKACYDLGVNAYVVKPVDYKDFVDAIKKVGIFWAVINEIPPQPIH